MSQSDVLDGNALKALQAPLKEKYRQDADAAVVTLRAKGELDLPGIACRVETGRALVEGGPAPGHRRQRNAGSARATCCWKRWSPAPA